MVLSVDKVIETAGFHVLKNNQRCKLISYMDLPCRALRDAGNSAAPPRPDMDYRVHLSWFYEYVTAEREASFARRPLLQPVRRALIEC